MTFHVTITGGSAPYEVYGGLVVCDDYLLGSESDGADAYRAANDDRRKRLLVQATRFIDSLAWRGAPTFEGGTTLQWPRSGLTKENGTDFSSIEQLALVSRATFEMVAILAVDRDAITAVDSGSNIRSMGAGSARIEFFRPSSIEDGTATALPLVLHRLLGRYLAGATASGVSSGSGFASGTGATNHFDDGDRLTRTEPF